MKWSKLSTPELIFDAYRISAGPEPTSQVTETNLSQFLSGPKFSVAHAMQEHSETRCIFVSESSVYILAIGKAVDWLLVAFI